MSLGIIPADKWLLYSGFSVTLGSCTLHSLYGGPDFCLLAKIDNVAHRGPKTQGTAWQIITNIIIPLSARDYDRLDFCDYDCRW